MKARAAFLAAAWCRACSLLEPKTPFPRLVRSGGHHDATDFDGETPNSISSHVRRPGTIRVLSSTDHELFTRAFVAADRGDWGLAVSLAAQGHDGQRES